MTTEAKHELREQERANTSTAYCPRCDHSYLFVDGNGICRSLVAGCSEPCGCRCREIAARAAVAAAQETK